MASPKLKQHVVRVDLLTVSRIAAINQLQLEEWEGKRRRRLVATTQTPRQPMLRLIFDASKTAEA